MKRILGIAAVLLLMGTAAFGADVDGRLPAGTPEQVKASAREAVRAGIDPDEVAALTARMAENRFSERLTVRAYEIMTAARREGLPVGPIVSKAYEGMAKHVAAEKTVQAMETVHSRYSLGFREARTLAAEDRQQQVLGRSIAEGLAAGVREGDMARMAETLQQHSRQIGREQKSELAIESFMTVREMARLGVPSATVADVVCQALQHQYSAREMAQMRNTFAAEARQGKAESIAQQYGAQIGGGMRGEGLGGSGSGGHGGGASGPDGSGGAGGGSGGGSGSGGSGGSGGGGGGGGGGK